MFPTFSLPFSSSNVPRACHSNLVRMIRNTLTCGSLNSNVTHSSNITHLNLASPFLHLHVDAEGLGPVVGGEAVRQVPQVGPLREAATLKHGLRDRPLRRQGGVRICRLSGEEPRHRAGGTDQRAQGQPGEWDGLRRIPVELVGRGGEEEGERVSGDEQLGQGRRKRSTIAR